MKSPNIKTKVVHSKSKNAYNVVGTEPGKKFKIARIPYLVVASYPEVTKREKKQALEHAEFISICFNNSERIVKFVKSN